ncbi:hypothetical protein D3C85_959650 [compost metagenome]
MVQGQPADDHIVRVEVDAKAPTDQLFIGHQVAVADLHALGQRCRAGGVLQEGDVIGRQVRHLPVAGQAAVEAIDAQ